MITVLFFASIRDSTGIDRYTVAYSPDLKTVSDVVAHCRKALPKLDQHLNSHAKLMYALNQEMVRQAAGISDGDELALLPPVTGG